jgi:hypothetical protein
VAEAEAGWLPSCPAGWQSGSIPTGWQLSGQPWNSLASTECFGEGAKGCMPAWPGYASSTVPNAYSDLAQICSHLASFSPQTGAGRAGAHVTLDRRPPSSNTFLQTHGAILSSTTSSSTSTSTSTSTITYAMHLGIYTVDMYSPSMP